MPPTHPPKARMGDSSCLIDDLSVPVQRVSSVEEVGDLVRRAVAEGLAIYPLGGRTMLGLGNRPTKPGIGVDLRSLDQVIDYPARDMTITVQAGITVARLQALLAPENQRLPIDVPRAAQATLGGILATNISGPRRYGYGTLRDYVLGISAVNDEGEVIKAGGRVVKNVAGYDLCKLYTGSLGTLGVITQVTLKLRPRVEEQAIVTVCCAAESVDDLLERVHRSRTRPVCIELLNSAAGDALPQSLARDGEGWRIVVGYEGNGEAVKWQVEQIVRELETAAPPSVRMGAAALPCWDALTESLLPSAEEETLSFKANVLPSATAAFCRDVGSLAPGSRLQAQAGNGIVRGQIALADDQAVKLLAQLRSRAATAHGRVVVIGCPPQWKYDFSVWGPGGNDSALMRAVKEKLDPRRLFNPGRFVDGL